MKNNTVPVYGPNVWRHPRWLIGFFVLVCLAFASLSISLGIDGQASAPEVTLWATPGLVLTWLLLVRPRIVLTDDEVIVVRPLTTRRYQLRSIVDAAPGYYGTTFTSDDDSTFSAATLQRPNYAAWFGRTSRADRVATLILTAAARLRNDPAPEPLGGKRNAGDIKAGFWAGVWAAIAAAVAGGA